MTKLFSPMTFKTGQTMKNRFMLAPLTNLQSHIDGTLSDDEYHWLTMRAKGGFGATMTCASHVSPEGLGFPGQLGCFDDSHIDGLSRLASGIKAENSVALIQLHHAGMRAHESIEGKPVCPSDNAEFGARALSLEEVESLRDKFVAAALRAEQAGFNGVELHGAHGYVIAQFLSPTINQRDDHYGGSLENRSRLLREIIDAIRTQCRKDFILGLRLSPERFDIDIAEMRTLAQELCNEGNIDFLDMSLWDAFKEPEDAAFKGRRLIDCFAELDRGDVLLGVAGKVHTLEGAQQCLDAGADFVLLGRAAILNHDFPKQAADNPDFVPTTAPVTADYLRKEGLGEAFIGYMSTWKGFVEG
jgi:2,4-dienoyl-CoA reductase-like NADH-dependent reductase (Old Yellow Enzyme family)